MRYTETNGDCPQRLTAALLVGFLVWGASSLSAVRQGLTRQPLFRQTLYTIFSVESYLTAIRHRQGLFRHTKYTLFSVGKFLAGCP